MSVSNGESQCPRKMLPVQPGNTVNCINKSALYATCVLNLLGFVWPLGLCWNSRVKITRGVSL